MFKYMCSLDIEFCKLLDLKTQLDFLELRGKDVSVYQNYINSKIKEVQMLEIECHKVNMIHRRQLSTSCFRKCDYNCLSCTDNKI